MPVVIFLGSGNAPAELRLGGDRHNYMSFRYLSCALAALPYERYRDSDNVVARLNLPNMAYPPEHKVEVYAHAVRGLFALEPDVEKCLKYLDFIDIYTGLDDNERVDYARRFPREAEKMTSFAERFEQEGIQKGMQQGLQQGEARVLIRQLTRRFGELPEALRRRIEEADTETLLEWSERVLTAQSLDEVVH